MLGEASLLAGSYIDSLMETRGLGKSWKRPSPEFEAGY